MLTRISLGTLQLARGTQRLTLSAPQPGNLQRPRHLGDRYPLLQPPHCGQLELLGELPARQSYDSILHSMDFES
jgi:hypothetical protein